MVFAAAPGDEPAYVALYHALSAFEGGMGGNYLGNQFAGRSGSTRVKMLQEGGGNARSEASVASGLEWLALHQAQDGHWSLHEFNHSARDKPRPAGKIHTCNCVVGSTQRNDIAATGFGLLPFLAGGITHKPTKTKTKDYSKTVEGGPELAHVQAEQGRLLQQRYVRPRHRHHRHVRGLWPDLRSASQAIRSARR